MLGNSEPEKELRAIRGLRYVTVSVTLKNKGLSKWQTLRQICSEKLDTSLNPPTSFSGLTGPESFEKVVKDWELDH